MSNIRPSAIILLSSGLDSSVNLFAAQREYDVKLALTMDYGQRAAVKELESSENLCKSLGVKFQRIDLPWFQNLGTSALLSETRDLPQGTDVHLDSLSVSQQTAQKVWVPNRNGIFLQIAAGFAEALEASEVIVGFNSEEAATFPDNSHDFMKATDKALFYSTQNHVTITCFTAEMNKSQIVRYGIQLGVPFQKLWPCYFGQAQWCGVCESCQRFKRALELNGIDLFSKVGA